MPRDEEITFADHMGRFYARRYAYPPMVGRVLGYLLVCEPRDQTIAELSEALLASRSAITGALNVLERTDAIRRSRAAGERMDRVRIDFSSAQARGFDISEYEELGALAREGLEVAVMPRQNVGRSCSNWRRSQSSSSRAPKLFERSGRRVVTLSVPRASCPPEPRGRPPTSIQPLIGKNAMTDSSSPAITAVDVRKSFGDNVVLDGLELAVEPGTVFALLGPNGAGKTTMVRILATLLEADHGTIRVAGHDVSREADAVRAAIGVTGQFSAIDELLTGRENLTLMADLNHLARASARERIDQLLEQFELGDAADRIAMTYSGGMRRRLDLAMTLIGAPKVIFLDEPTTGLDPRSRRTVWEIVESLVEDGTTVFLTTQYLDEADKLADRVAILDRGRLVAEGSATGAQAATFQAAASISASPTPRRNSWPASRWECRCSDRNSPSLQIPTDGNVATLRRVLRDLDEAGVDVVDLAIHTPDLDDVFLALTGRDAHVAQSRTEQEVHR